MAFTRKQIVSSQEDPNQTENGPWRAAFLNILGRAKLGQPITYAEGEYLYRGLKVSKIDADKPENIVGCNNYRFVYTFLTYAPDLNGASVLLDFKGQPISIPRKQTDIASLDQFAEQWESIIVNHNQTSDALRIISKEARFELKELDKQPEFYEYGFFRRCNTYEAKRRRIILHSKFVYCKHLEVFEELATGENTFTLNTNSLEFTEFSFLHILFRHYAQAIKQTAKPGKSYHNEDITPNKIVSILGQIISQIDGSGLFVGQDIGVLNFEYKSVDYKVYVNKRFKSVPGTAAVSYWRIETFFPIEDPAMKSDLATSYTKVQVNDSLFVYTK